MCCCCCCCCCPRESLFIHILNTIGFVFVFVFVSFRFELIVNDVVIIIIYYWHCCCYCCSILIGRKCMWWLNTGVGFSPIVSVLSMRWHGVRCYESVWMVGSSFCACCLLESIRDCDGEETTFFLARSYCFLSLLLPCGSISSDVLLPIVVVCFSAAHSTHSFGSFSLLCYLHFPLSLVPYGILFVHIHIYFLFAFSRLSISGCNRRIWLNEITVWPSRDWIGILVVSVTYWLEGVVPLRRLAWWRIGPSSSNQNRWFENRPTRISKIFIYITALRYQPRSRHLTYLVHSTYSRPSYCES